MSKRKIFTFKNKRHIPTWLLWIIVGILRLYTKTFRVNLVDKHNFLHPKDNLPVIFAIWHNRILFLPSLGTRELLQKCTVLISKSRDGEYIANISQRFGLNVTRGSSSKGALHALLDLSEALETGLSPIITLDGPRGPRYCPHPGATMLAMQHNVPIVPVAVNTKSFWQLKSWDKLQIPYPFAKIDFIFGEPLFLPKELSREEALQRLQQAMDSIHTN